jgi:hypothetical protein
VKRGLQQLQNPPAVAGLAAPIHCFHSSWEVMGDTMYCVRNVAFVGSSSLSESGASQKCWLVCSTALVLFTTQVLTPSSNID